MDKLSRPPETPGIAHDLKDRDRLEGKFGEIGEGAQELTIEGVVYNLRAIMTKLNISFDDTTPIDAVYLPAEDLYALRYYDGEVREIVAYVFDKNFVYKYEDQANIIAWLGEEEYFKMNFGIWCPWSA
jgi:hypothetical protein